MPKHDLSSETMCEKFVIISLNLGLKSLSKIRRYTDEIFEVVLTHQTMDGGG